MGWFTVSTRDDKVRVDVTGDDDKTSSFFETDPTSARDVANMLNEGADRVEQAREDGA